MKIHQLMLLSPLMLGACGSTLSASARQPPPAPMTQSEPLYIFRTDGSFADYQFISGARFERQAGQRVRFHLMWTDPDPRYVDASRWDIVLIDGDGRKLRPTRRGDAETVRLVVQYGAGADSRYARTGPPHSVDDGPLHPLTPPATAYVTRQWVDFDGVGPDTTKLRLEARRGDLDGHLVLSYSWQLDRFWPTQVRHHGRNGGLRYSSHLVPGPTTRPVDYVDAKKMVVEPFYIRKR